MPTTARTVSGAEPLSGGVASSSGPTRASERPAQTSMSAISPPRQSRARPTIAGPWASSVASPTGPRSRPRRAARPGWRGRTRPCAARAGRPGSRARAGRGSRPRRGRRARPRTAARPAPAGAVAGGVGEHGARQRAREDEPEVGGVVLPVEVGRGRGEQDDEAGDRQHDERGPRDGARGVVWPAFGVGARLGEGHGRGVCPSGRGGATVEAVRVPRDVAPREGGPASVALSAAGRIARREIPR